MTSTIRAARPEDIPHLAALQVLGSHGIIEAIYHDLMPGKTVAEMIERRFLFEGSSKSYKNCWVVEVDGEVAGDLHAHLYDDMDGDPPDPIVPEERYGVVEPMIAIEKPAYGTFHINILAIYPRFQRRGLGTTLLDLAKAQAQERGLAEVSLVSFEDNEATALYLRQGFREVDRAAPPRHPLIHNTGDLLMMVASA